MGGKLNYGGISIFVMNVYRYLNNNGIHIDFLIHGYDEGDFDEEILASGSTIWHVPVKSKDPIGNYRQVTQVIKKGKYSVIHSHMDAMNFYPLLIAKRLKIPVRISHCHCSDYLTQNRIKRFINDYYKKKISSVATHLFASSKKAGEWLYGKSVEFDIINNGIVSEKFEYNHNLRSELRASYNLNDNNIIIGCVAVFEFYKNHMFLIDVFYEIFQRNNNYRLVMVGDGSMKEAIEEKCCRLGLEDKVIIIKPTNEIHMIYNMFDIFSLCSLFEGLPFVAIEAQCNGLKCIVSSAVPDEAVLLDSLERLPIDVKPVIWAETILNASLERCPDAKKSIEKRNFSASVEAERLRKMYFDAVNIS